MFCFVHSHVDERIVVLNQSFIPLPVKYMGNKKVVSALTEINNGGFGISQFQVIIPEVLFNHEHTVPHTNLGIP